MASEIQKVEEIADTQKLEVMDNRACEGDCASKYRNKLLKSDRSHQPSHANHNHGLKDEEKPVVVVRELLRGNRE